MSKVHESQVDKVRPNMKVGIRVDAFTGEFLSGAVADVSPLPDTANFFNAGTKVYTTHVRIDHPPAHLRPGMSAQAEILISELDNVLGVPTQAVLRYDGKDHVAVKKPGGGFEWRAVALGISNGEQVEVKEGIKSGEAVIKNPISLMSEPEKREKFGFPPSATLPASPKFPAKPAS